MPGQIDDWRGRASGGKGMQDSEARFERHNQDRAVQISGFLLASDFILPQHVLTQSHMSGNPLLAQEL